MNQQSGIGIAESSSLRSFRPFFVEFTIPYSVIRGEQVQIPVTVYNYLNYCVRVGNESTYRKLHFYEKIPSHILNRKKTWCFAVITSVVF